MVEPSDGRQAIDQPGFSYLPRFIEQDEAEALIEYFGAIRPIWEQRFGRGEHKRDGAEGRRLTRPVYWLGAWQFACLGYYAEPHYRLDRCLRAEPFPPVMDAILDRLRGVLADHHSEPERPPWPTPNTCLINYYGREVGRGVPVDFARLRMHRDGEPGPVIMFNIGQAGLLEFLDPDRSPEPELRLWTRHRSVTIISGAEFKDRLYHRVAQVRTGADPALQCHLDNFEVRRISVSFRVVPEELISDFSEWDEARRGMVRGYLRELSGSSEHFERQLAGAPGSTPELR